METRTERYGTIEEMERAIEDLGEEGWRMARMATVDTGFEAGFERDTRPPGTPPEASFTAP